MADIVIDVSEIARLATNLTQAGPRTVAAVQPVMARAGMNMKRQGQAEARGIQDGRVAAAWSYDTTTTVAGVRVEAGPRTGGAGSLAFFYFGNSKIGPRLPDPIGLLNAEAGRTAQFLGAAVEATFR